MQQSKLLSSYDGSRRNNFTTIRFALAWMVIYSHSFALQPAPGVGNPLGSILQGSASAGQMAVDGFFAISGFLVAGSLLNRGLIDYTLSRLLRVIPGLAVCIFLMVFLLGPSVSSLSIAEYFSNSETWKYLRNALAVPFMFYKLPGVFEGNTSAGVNGSLWSIPYEMRCYIALGIAGLLGVFRGRKITNLVFSTVILIFFVSYINPKFLGFQKHVSSALLHFFIGVLIFSNRDKLILDLRLALVAMAALYFSFGEPWFYYIYPVTWPYILFFLAYKTRFLNIDKNIGDCSYGVYIYAFPVQQLAAYLIPSGTPYTNMLITTIVVVPLALLSWRYIEKPGLGLKNRYLTHGSSS